jgi:4-hydroxybenzoate polyprenyltransferase
MSLRGAASFVRLSALGGTFAIVAAGAVSGARLPSPPATAGLALLAVLFHTFAYVSNDVADLELDRTEPRRAASPLVRGTIRPVAALAVAVTAAAGAIAVGFVIAGGGAVVFAVGGLAVYNVWGKRCRWPVATDGVQGLGWAALAIGASWAGGEPSPKTGLLAVAIVAFILLANGVHGALRDLHNDLPHGVRSTAIVFGARPRADGAIVVPEAVRTYAFVLHWIVSVAMGAFVLRGGGGAVVAVGVLAVAGHAALRVAARGTADVAGGVPGVGGSAGMVHLVLLLGELVVATVARLPAVAGAAVAAAFVVPLLAHPWLPDAARWAWRETRIGTVGRLVRLPNVAVAATATLLGAYLSKGSALHLPVVWRAAAAAALVVAFGNAANDVADIAVDRLRRPDRPLPSGGLTVAGARRIAGAAGLGAVLLALTLPATAAWFVAATVVLSVGYDLRLKGTVLVGNAVVALLSASTLPFGALVAGGRVAPAVLAGSLVFAFMLAFEVLKDVDDRDADAAVGLRTVATVLGPGRALRILRALPAALVGVGFAGWWLGLAPVRYLVPAVPATLGPAVAAAVLVRGAPTPWAVRTAIRVLKAGWLSGLAVMLLLR